MGVQCSLTGSNSEEVPVVFREGEGSQRELFGKDTKLKLEDCLGVRYTRDSRDDPGVGGVFFKYMKNRLAGSRGHMQGVGKGGPPTQLFSQPSVFYFLLELTSELPLNLSPLILPTDTLTYTPQG